MRQHLAILFLIFGCFYVCASIAALIIGVSDAASTYQKTDCYHPKKYEYILPAYRLGCWLGEDQ